MHIRVQAGDATALETPLLAIGLLQGEATPARAVGPVGEAILALVEAVHARGDFKGKEGETLVLYPATSGLSAERVLLVGLGSAASVDGERIRKALGTMVKQAVKLGVGRVAVVLPLASIVERLSTQDAAQAAAEGAVLGGYLFDEMKTGEEDAARKKVEEVVIAGFATGDAAGAEHGVRVGSALGRGENLARRLGDLPGNIATPTYLADTAREIGGRHGMTVTVLGRAELEAEGLATLLAVSRGSDEEPRLIVLEHRAGPAGGKPIVLLGKGLTFDSGGISIKPAPSMEDMKYDMCGGAAVLGAMEAIGELELPVNVVGVVPASENLLSGSAMKPGDIIRSHLGKTIEIVNTDAEGRLILADALSYLKRFEPAAVVDAATLTGACVIALGHQASAALGNDEALIEEVRRAGERAGQRVWPLPMYDEYREQIKSDYADIKNSGGRAAGTITAAWFLREFVGDFPWVHLDVAGTAYGDGKPSYLTKGATGAPTRLFVEWVLARAS